MNENGQVVVGNLVEYFFLLRLGSFIFGLSLLYDLDWIDNYEEDDYVGGDIGVENVVVQVWECFDVFIFLYFYEVINFLEFLNQCKLF